MSNESNHINLYPELDDELDAAYAQAQDASRQPVGIAAIAATAANEAGIRADLAPDFEEQLEKTRNLTKRIFEGRLMEDITVPTIEEFAEAGFNFPLLAEAYQAMDGLGYEPRIVMTPTLSVEEWLDIYEALKSEPEIKRDKINAHNLLYFHEEYESEDRHGILPSAGKQELILDSMWEVVVMPGADRPPFTIARGVVMSGGPRDIGEALDIPGLAPNDSGIPVLPSIATYLSFQAQELLTEGTFADGAYGFETLLSGELRNMRGALCISAGEIMESGALSIAPVEYMMGGCRPTVWGNQP